MNILRVDWTGSRNGWPSIAGLGLPRAAGLWPAAGKTARALTHRARSILQRAFFPNWRNPAAVLQPPAGPTRYGRRLTRRHER